VELAQDHRARGAEPGDGRRVLGGDRVREAARARRRPEAGRVVQILECDRDAVQRATIDAVREVGIGAFGLGQRAFRGERDERAELALVPRDAIQARAHEVDGRCSTGMDQCGRGLER